MAAASFFPDILYTWRQLAVSRGQSRAFVGWVHAVRLKPSAEHRWDATEAALLLQPPPTPALCLKNAAQFCPTSSLLSIRVGGTSVCLVLDLVTAWFRREECSSLRSLEKLHLSGLHTAQVWMDSKIKGCPSLFFKICWFVFLEYSYTHGALAAKSLLSAPHMSAHFLSI